MRWTPPAASMLRWEPVTNPTCKLPRAGWTSPRTCSGAHGVDARGRVVLRKRLMRAKVLVLFANRPCQIGLEAWRWRPLLGTGTARARARGAPDAAALRQGAFRADLGGRRWGW